MSTRWRGRGDLDGSIAASTINSNSLKQCSGSLRTWSSLYGAKNGLPNITNPSLFWRNLDTHPDIRVAMIGITVTNNAVPCNKQPDRIHKKQISATQATTSTEPKIKSIPRQCEKHATDLYHPLAVEQRKVTEMNSDLEKGRSRHNQEKGKIKERPPY